jgi:LCP family protein required for cell wall assembly
MIHKRRILLGLLLLGLLAAFLLLPAYLYQRPLGPSLHLIPPAIAAAAQGEQNSVHASLQKSTPTPKPTKTPPPKTGNCGGKGELSLLMLGQSLPENHPRGADAIRLMVVDYDTPSVSILSMPPDVWVETTTLPDIEATRLTMAFGYGEGPSQGDPAKARKGTEVVAQALLDNFLFETQKYLTVDQPVFKDMVDTLEGVEVNVLEYADGTPEGYGVYEPGLQEMDGQRALDYLRMLQPAGQPPSEWGRFSRQNQVIAGTQNELFKPENWIKIPRLINDFYHLLVTDLSPRELKGLNCMIQKVGGQVAMYEVTPEMVTVQPDGAMVPDVEAIRALIAALQNGP